MQYIQRQHLHTVLQTTICCQNPPHTWHVMQVTRFKRHRAFQELSSFQLQLLILGIRTVFIDVNAETSEAPAPTSGRRYELLRQKTDGWKL